MGKIVNQENKNPYFQQSMFLVPMDSKGLKIERYLSVYGYDDAPHGHAEISFDNVRIPKENLILGEGRGFEIAQGRLGPGRIHHCMRLIGMAERALNTMKRRVLTRTAFKTLLSKFATTQCDIAQSRCDIEQARLLTLQCAFMMDTLGNKHARDYISMIKIVAPNMACRVIDRAIQAYGAGGVSQDTELAYFWSSARSLRIADGPDVVHEKVIAKLELLHSKL